MRNAVAVSDPVLFSPIWGGGGGGIFPSLHEGTFSFCVRSLQKMEVQETDKEKDGVAPKPKMVHYYYISYQQFVNVVKYKLDQMRKKLESEDKMVNSIVVPINLLLLLLLLLLCCCCCC